MLRYSARRLAKEQAKLKLELSTNETKRSEKILSMQEEMEKKRQEALVKNERTEIHRKEFYDKHTQIAKFDFPDVNVSYRDRKIDKDFSQGWVGVIPHPGQLVPGPYGKHFQGEKLHILHPGQAFMGHVFGTLGGLDKYLPEMFGLMKEIRGQALQNPYDSRRETKDYYIYAVNNLVEHPYNCWASLPSEVRSVLDDDLMNMSRFAFIWQWMLNKFYTDVPEKELQKTKPSILPQWLRGKFVKDQHFDYTHLRPGPHQGKKYNCRLEVTIPKCKDRQYFIYLTNKYALAAQREKMGNVRKVLADNKGVVRGEQVASLKDPYKYQLILKQEQQLIEILLEESYSKGDFELAQMMYTVFTYQRNVDVPPSVIYWLVEFININLKYLSLYSPLELMACSQNFKAILPPFNDGSEGYEPLSVLDLQEEKLLVSKPIHDILLAAKISDQVEEGKMSYWETLKNEYRETGHIKAQGAHRN